MDHRCAGRSALLVVALTASLSVGCVSLTDSQFEEVGKFGVAAKAYQTLPGPVFAGAADVRRARGVLRVANRPIVGDEERRRTAADKAWGQLLEADATANKLRATGAQADSYLAVIQIYGDLLVTLASDQFNDELEKQAQELGKQVDRAIAVANKASGGSIGAVGDGVAKAVTGIGGMWIRRRQAVYVREAVDAANEAIGDISKGVSGLLKEFAQPQLPEGTTRLTALYLADDELPPEARRCDAGSFVLCGEIEDIGAAVSGIAKREGGLDSTRGGEALALLAKIDAIHALAGAATKASADVAAAHEKLKQALDEKRSLKESIGEIRQMVQSVQDARKLAAKLQSAGSES